MWTGEYGCADDVEKSELVDDVCEEYFERMKVIDSLPTDMSLEEQDLYM